MTIRYVRVDLKPVRIETRHVFVPPPPPLPMRARSPQEAPPPLSRLAALAADLRAVGTERKRRAAERAALRAAETGAPVVTAAELRAARVLAGRTQRAHADAFKCSRSALASAELDVRPPLPAIARWTAETLARHAQQAALAAIETREGAP